MQIQLLWERVNPGGIELNIRCVRRATMRAGTSWLRKGQTETTQPLLSHDTCYYLMKRISTNYNFIFYLLHFNRSFDIFLLYSSSLVHSKNNSHQTLPIWEANMI